MLKHESAEDRDLNILPLDAWYTAGQAAEALTKKSKRIVKPDYLRSLVRLGKVRVKKLDRHTSLYLKVDVDSYTVEARGQKSGRVQQIKAKQKNKI